jgi:hypothetical protein
MGDLRNKIAKLERDEAHGQFMALRHPKKPPPPPPIRCQCGLTVHEVPAMWAHQADRWSPQRFCCPGYLPDEPLGEVIQDAAIRQRLGRKEPSRSSHAPGQSVKINHT